VNRIRDKASNEIIKKSLEEERLTRWHLSEAEYSTLKKAIRLKNWRAI